MHPGRGCVTVVGRDADFVDVAQTDSFDAGRAGARHSRSNCELDQVPQNSYCRYWVVSTTKASERMVTAVRLSLLDHLGKVPCCCVGALPGPKATVKFCTSPRKGSASDRTAPMCVRVLASSGSQSVCLTSTATKTMGAFA